MVIPACGNGLAAYDVWHANLLQYVMFGRASAYPHRHIQGSKCQEIMRGCLPSLGITSRETFLLSHLDILSDQILDGV